MDARWCDLRLIMTVISGRFSMTGAFRRFCAGRAGGSRERMPGGVRAGGAWAERGHAPGSFGLLIFLLKPIRQPVSGCRSSREDVHLWPKSRWFEGKFDEKVRARYAELTVYSDTGADVCVGEFRMYGPDAAAAGLDLGTDLSFTPQELAAGARFSYDGRPGTPVTITRDAGANYVRMRLWVAPPPGYSDLTSDLALAQQVHAAGMKIYLDIMYSDFWADPQHQNIPAAWAGQDLSQLTATVQSYTQQVITAFARQGTPADLVSIGNEIRNGILWPVGEINCTSCGGWDNLAQLLKAGVAGAKAGNPAGHKMLILMHYDQGGDNALSSAFYAKLVSEGVPFDVIGLSYYPFFHGAISAMRANVDELATQFRKPIVISETQYPWTLANGNSPLGDSTGDFVWQTSQLSPGYPASPGGQLSFVTDELSILAQVPDGLGAGLFYWSPEWIPGVGWEPGAGVGSPNVNLTLFNFQGTALPSIGIFQNPAAVCRSYDAFDVPCVIGG